jgi:hypothetical protein
VNISVSASGYLDRLRAAVANCDRVVSDDRDVAYGHFQKGETYICQRSDEIGRRYQLLTDGLARLPLRLKKQGTINMHVCFARALRDQTLADLGQSRELTLVQHEWRPWRRMLLESAASELRYWL